MDVVGNGYRGGADRRGSAGPDGIVPRQQYPSSTSTMSMGPPSSASSRGIAASAGQGNYASMTGAGFALQDVDHPPSKSATGGQSHGHRPVSAMPTPSSRSHQSNPRQADAGVLNTINNTAYNDRRASAHPTMSSQSHQSSAMSPPLPLSPNGSILDSATSGAINNGIPITSPAALQYFAAHPRRQQVHFGNYLLLQTLGEGEFGKVKLGVHKEWGEEVAVKLIKREKVGTPDGHLQITGPSKDPSKMSKVEKEIRVLKDVRHPNIVRLYEVIESDRYIGIVLEYASGGELFDHILAHKYLKERDACRLFAQLISGVSYLHQKKIVHRDLKLENLLLDRNRNVIITDFGFANNFENRKDDLMATSCGSPCYAAPELVVQDGLYAGSAVDVWSCGVILYAMLAGYLPYDDDPKNPEGDNINLLYKYIMATPLSFPDYISAEPRDLLCKMLVPDPVKRADLDTVMSHHWLAPYRDLFRFTVDDLERAAIEQQNKKRVVYRQQMMMQQQMAEQQMAAGRGSRSSGSVAQDGASTAKQQRHQSAMPTSSTVADKMYDGGAAIVAPVRSRPVTGLPTPVAAPMEVLAPLDRDVPQGGVEQPSRYVAQSPSSSSAVANNKKSAGQKVQRHTIQLEYDAPSSSDRRREVESNRSALSAAEAVPPVPRVPRHEEMLPSIDSESNVAIDESVLPTAPAEAAYIAASPIVIPSAEQRTSNGAKTSSANKITSEVMLSERGAPSPAVTTNTAKRNSVSSRIASNPLPPNGPQEELFASPKDRVVSGGAGPRPEARKSIVTPRASEGRAAAANSVVVPSKSEQSSAERSANRHRKGMSTDKSFLSRLMATPSSNGSEYNSSPGRPTTAISRQEAERPKTPDSKAAEAAPGRKTSSSRRKAMSLVVGRYGDQSKPSEPSTPSTGGKTTKEERRLTGRARKETLTGSGGKYETPKRTGTASSQQQRQPAGVSPSSASVVTRNGSIRQSSQGSKVASPGPPFDQRFNESNSTVGPSSNAAKKVMDWFRKKSLSRGAFEEKPPLGPFEVESSQDLNRSGRSQGREATPPRLVVTNVKGKEEEKVETIEAGALESVPSSRSTSGTHSQTSQATDATGVTTATETSALSGAGSGNKSSASTVLQQPTPRASATMKMSGGAQKMDDSALRLHQGAVDQSALTSRAPDDVFEQVRKALFDMGIDVKKEREEDFKFECVRRKRAKTLIGATQGLGVSIRTSVFPPSQADFERSSAARSPGSPGGMSQLSTSPSTAGSLRNLLRRGSSQQNAGSALDDSLQPAPIYGEASVDGGQEVRFSVEVTKIKNLPGLYSLDIRRMKGNLWAYKFLYHALLDRCELGGKSQSG